MPPRKRAASSTGTTSSKPGPAKKQARSGVGKSATDGGGGDDDDGRWSAVSCSRNAQNLYKTVVAKFGDEAYAFKPLSRVPGCEREEDDDGDDDDEDEDEDEESDKENKDNNKKNGDGEKPAAAGTEDNNNGSSGSNNHQVITKAGFQKFAITNVHASLRDPANFNMDTYNDHGPYGIIEVLQNLFLDYAAARAAAHWGPSWAIIEATVLFLNCGAAEMMYMCEDGELVTETMELVARMFLDSLARLEREKLLGPDSPVKSLPLIIAIMLLLDQSCTLFETIGDNDNDDCDDDGDSSSTAKQATLPVVDWADFVRQYAHTYKITTKGLPKLPNYEPTEKDKPDKAAAELERFALPKVTDGVTDPWNWTAELTKYSKGKNVGGDEHDITAWSSAERKASSFDGKDPLTRSDIAALKAGKVMSMA